MKKSHLISMRSNGAWFAMIMAGLYSGAGASLAYAETSEGNEPIIVTGSHLLRPADEVANASSSISAEQIALTGKTNISEILIRHPALSASIGPAQASGIFAPMGYVGVNVLNLRNLGPERSLVLVNGKRHVAAVSGTAAVDINNMPMALIERVDVLTGGASAIYGADGVTGVVNFILKRDFEGLSANMQAGLSSKGDAASQRFAITGGKNFAEGRGNIALSYEFNASDALHVKRRKATGDPNSYSRMILDTSDPDNPRFYRQNNLTLELSAPSGVVATSNGDLYLGDGTPYEMGVLLNYRGFAIGGNNTQAAGFHGDLMPEVKSHLVNLLTSFEVSPQLRFYAEGKYSGTKAQSVGRPAFLTNILLMPFNPYLQNRFGPDVAGEGAFILGRDSFDLGLQGERDNRKSYRFVAGFDGSISDHLRYDVFANYGRTTVKTVQSSAIIEDRLYAALNAIQHPFTGQTICLSTLDPMAPIDFLDLSRPITSFTPGEDSSCRPLNLLGEGVADQAAIDFIMADEANHSRLSQLQIGAVINGDTGAFFELGGGPIGFAFGAEYRRERSAFTPNSYLAKGEIFDQGVILANRGQFDVKELFAEVNLPLLSNKPLAEKLSLGGAVRFADYSTIHSATTWKLDALYAPVQELRFRGTYSQAMRAPNIYELFRPETTWNVGISDPCTTSFRNAGSQYRIANCEALLAGLGLDSDQIAVFNPDSQNLYRGINVGNADARKERATSWTVGASFEPRFAPGLSLSFDYYDIKIKDVIASADPTELAELCVDLPSLNNFYCSQIFRDPESGEIVGGQSSDGSEKGFIMTSTNMASLKTSGFDLGLKYQFSPNPKWGNFIFLLNAGYLDKMDRIAADGAEVEQLAAGISNPRWRGNTSLSWSLDNVTLHYSVNYWSKTQRYSRKWMEAYPNSVAPENRWIKAKVEQDVRASFSVAQKYRFYAGMNNIFDRQPDFDIISYPINGVGRYLYAGVAFDI